MPAESHELRHWLASGAHAVKRARNRLDAINVFPVPDSDTGTNLYLTLQEGNRAVAKLPPTASHREVVAAFARGALLGARGNSGVIVSQYLAAFLTHVDKAGGLSNAKPVSIAMALQEASDAAYGAVGAPVEGTILSVAQAASTGAADAVATKADRNAVIVAAVVSARAALRSTSDELPAAKAAGVVDAGAAGLVLQLEMLAETLAGSGVLRDLDYVEWELASTGKGVVAVPARHEDHEAGGAYEVMFVATTPERSPHAKPAPDHELTQALAALGDSVAVTASHGLVHAHVHTNVPDQAVEEGIVRHARQILVSAIALGHARESHNSRQGTGMVALTSCPGLAAPLADAGAVVLVVPDPSRLKRRELRRAVREASSHGVVIAAGNAPLRAAAEELAARKGVDRVVALPADHEAHVIAAIAAGATVTPGEPLAEVMRQALARCDVARSSPDAIDDDADRLLQPDTEVVTVILARGVSDATADSVRLSAAAVCPHADVTVYQGGHLEPGVLIGVERGA
ncbi:DAK2 domain-containing protein [Demequina sp.]|uniref:DAK2 domain-containing protein n=1 Tax=Demequina sp. TaxID=2050685 RepID=UPI0025BEB2BC|nr:DAK2 domain-containing protein [Demequina sp.]